jgi:hypothetical protein
MIRKLWILQDVMQSATYSSKFESTVKMSIEASGKITCKACNVVGCDSVTENILVSGKNTFFCVSYSYYNF